MRIIFHVGTHKTATTSIQHSLNNHREALANAGVFYPSYELIGAKNHYAHIGAINALSGDQSGLDRSEAKRFFKEARSRANDYDVTIFSAESVYRQLRSGIKPSILSEEDYWVEREAYLKELFDLIAPDEIAIVFRQQADYAESLYQEHIKATKYTRQFRVFLKEYWFHFEYLKHCQALDGRGVRVRAANFQTLKQSPGPVENFCKIFNIPFPEKLDNSHINPSLPVDFTILKRTLNRQGDLKKQNRRLVMKAAQVFENRSADCESAQRSFFRSIDEVQAFQDSFVETNKQLFSDYIDPGTNGQGEFGELKFAGRAFGDSLSPNFVREMLAAICSDE